MSRTSLVVSDFGKGGASFQLAIQRTRNPGFQPDLVVHASSVQSFSRQDARSARQAGCLCYRSVPYKLNPLACSICTVTSSPTNSSRPGNTTILLVRVRPIKRCRFVLLGPSQSTSTSRPTRL